MNSQGYVILSVLTALSVGHVYNGPAALRRSATEISIRGGMMNEYDGTRWAGTQ